MLSQTLARLHIGRIKGWRFHEWHLYAAVGIMIIYSEEYFASEVSHYIMTVFAFFTYTEYFIAQKCRGRKHE